MPAYSDITSVLDRQLLLQLGLRLKNLRQEQGLSGVALAQRIGISRTTLNAVESGEPAPSIGTYLRVMSALGVSGDLALLASGTLRAHPSESSGRKKSAKRNVPSLSITVAPSERGHEVQDLQSLMLHKEAIRFIHQKPELIQQALATLEHWRESRNTHSRFLWDEWSVILHRRDWRKALSNSRRGKELRQASPLPTILPSEVRADILAQIRALKAGMKLGQGEAAGDPAPPSLQEKDNES